EERVPPATRWRYQPEGQRDRSDLEYQKPAIACRRAEKRPRGSARRTETRRACYRPTAAPPRPPQHLDWLSDEPRQRPRRRAASFLPWPGQRVASSRAAVPQQSVPAQLAARSTQARFVLARRARAIGGAVTDSPSAQVSSACRLSRRDSLPTQVWTLATRMLPLSAERPWVGFLLPNLSKALFPAMKFLASCRGPALTQRPPPPAWLW